MCAPQEPPHHFTVVLSDMYASIDENPAFVNPFDFGNFDNVFVNDGDIDAAFFDLPPLDNSFDSMEYDPSFFDLLMAYELPRTLIASNMDPPPYLETSLEELVSTEGGLSADGSTYTPTFPAYDDFLSWSPPPALRLGENTTPYTPTFPAYDNFQSWSPPPALMLGENTTPYTPTFPAYDRLTPRALDDVFAPCDDCHEDDLLEALDALYEPEDEERRGFKRKLAFQ